MRVLVLQTRRLGDVLMVTPLLRALRRLDARAAVDVLVDRASAAALAGNPHVNEAVDASAPRVAALARVRRRRYDVVIDAMGKPWTALFALGSRAPMRIGFDGHALARCYTHRLPRPQPAEYSAIQKLRLGAPLGVPGASLGDCALDAPGAAGDAETAARWWTSLAIDGADRPPLAFSPASRRADKRWPPDRFAWLCDHLAARTGRRLLPFFGPGEEPQVAAVIARAASPAAFVHPVSVLPFTALPAALARCGGFVGNDNAIRHLAVALGLPTLAVFGRPRPSNWTPPGDARHLAAGGGGAIDDVTIETVAPLAAAFERRLAVR